MSKGQNTRHNILSYAFQMASEDGLESLTIGELAKKVGMSKSGLFAHFKSKDNLQVAVLEFANEVFVERVLAPARLAAPEDYESKLKQLLENWLCWNHSFQGSCMFLDAWKENNLAYQPTQQALKASIESWLEYLSIQIKKGSETKAFRADLDAKQATFELYGLYLSSHLYYSLHDKETSHRMFWQAVERLLASWK